MLALPTCIADMEVLCPLEVSSSQNTSIWQPKKSTTMRPQHVEEKKYKWAMRRQLCVSKF